MGNRLCCSCSRHERIAQDILQDVHSSRQSIIFMKKAYPLLGQIEIPNMDIVLMAIKRVVKNMNMTLTITPEELIYRYIFPEFCMGDTVCIISNSGGIITVLDKKILYSYSSIRYISMTTFFEQYVDMIPRYSSYREPLQMC